MSDRSPSKPPPDEPRGAARRLVAALLSWMALLVSLVWVFAALRLTRDDVGGIDTPDGPIAVVQLLVAVLGGLGAGVGASRAGWYLRTGQEGREAAAAVAGAAALLAAWLALVLPDW